MAEIDPALEPTEETTLADYVDAAGESDEAFVKECEDTATDLVDRFIGTATVPPLTRRLAILGAGSNLYAKRHSQTGSPSFSEDGGFMPAPRVARDPLSGAYALLRPYVGPGIG